MSETIGVRTISYILRLTVRLYGVLSRDEFGFYSKFGLHLTARDS